MIPKIIHYCWFGEKRLNKLSQKCITSWKKYCPNFEIKRWDESNFNIHINRYTEQAYMAKKYAFVSDFARFWILYHCGGIYMDTDVEIIKPLDSLLQNKMATGFETDYGVAPGLILLSEPKTRLLLEMIDLYNHQFFIDKNDNPNYKTVVQYFTETLQNHGLLLNGEMQTIADCKVYPKDYFSPIMYETKEINITSNTYSIHHYAATWLPRHVLIKKFIIRFVRAHFGDNVLHKIVNIKKHILAIKQIKFTIFI